MYFYIKWCNYSLTQLLGIQKVIDTIIPNNSYVRRNKKCYTLDFKVPYILQEDKSGQKYEHFKQNLDLSFILNPDNEVKENMRWFQFPLKIKIVV